MMLTTNCQEKLTEEIQSIRSLLSQDVDAVDSSTAKSLGNVLHEMEQLLADDSAGDFAYLQRKWQDAVLNFEVNHPDITNAVAAITSIFANAGI